MSAIVVERGGSLSSVATVARELGVPAVVGALGVLASVRQDESILVDGGIGWVYTLDAAEGRGREACLLGSPGTESPEMGSAA